MGIHAEGAERSGWCLVAARCGCATSGTKEQLGSTHGVYSVVVFSHSSQTVAQIHVPDSPAQHDLLLDPPYFSTVNLGRKEQKLDAGTARTRGTHLSVWSTVTGFSLGHSHWREWFCELPGFVNYLYLKILSDSVLLTRKRWKQESRKTFRR